jgi:HB1, ASXL, restriction endonuclease HTH domain
MSNANTQTYYKKALFEAKKDLDEMEQRRIALLNLIDSLNYFLKLNGEQINNIVITGDEEEDSSDIKRDNEIKESNNERQTKPEIISISYGSFANLTNKEACLKCLSAFKRPMTTREIVDVLLSAGVKHKSKDFWNTINNTLKRLKNDDKRVSKDTDGKWSLLPSDHSKLLTEQKITF